MSIALWSTERWRAEAVAWADAALAAAGLERTGDAEQPRLRPWATVLRIPTSAGAVWLKACAAQVAFEVPLYALLERVVPDRILTPYAVDVTRGWVLLPDGGPSLGERLRGPELVGALAEALPAYGALQRSLAPRVDELLALGVADMRPEALPARFEEALVAVRETLEYVGDGLERLEQVAALRPAVAEWCDRLAASPVPASLDHNDLHGFNVLAGPRFYDWGDAVVAHPFASMLALEWTGGDVTALRDAYLEPFSALAPHAALVEQLELACRLGRIARALVWYRAISSYGLDQVEPDWLTAPAETLFALSGSASPP